MVRTHASGAAAPRKPAPDGARKVVGFALKQQYVAALLQVAEREDATISVILRRWVKEKLTEEGML